MKELQCLFAKAFLVTLVVSMSIVPARASVSFKATQIAGFPGNGPVAAIVGDFNRDGISDVAVADGGDPGLLTILFGNNDGTFTRGGSYTSAGGSGPTSLVAGDFNHDGFADIALTSYSGFVGDPPGTIVILFGNGDGTFQAPVRVNYSRDDHPYYVTTADLNRDGNLDLVAANLPRAQDGQGTASVTILLGNADGTFQPPQVIAAGTAPISISVGDLNSDNIPDLIVPSGNDLEVLLGVGDGTFQPPVAYDAGVSPWLATLVDLNGDGNLDVAVVNNSGGTDAMDVLLGNGNGTLAAATAYVGTSGAVAGAVADINGDQHLDFVIAGTSAVSTFLGNGDGTFQPALTRSRGIGGDFRSLAVGDFNQDGNPDLVAADSGSAVTIFINETSHAPKATLSATKVTFGIQGLGTTSPPMEVTLTNTGNADLSVTSFTVANPEFTQTNDCGKSLAINTSCTISVTFRPTKSGIRTGKISIADNAAGSPQKIALQGTGR